MTINKQNLVAALRRDVTFVATPLSRSSSSALPASHWRRAARTCCRSGISPTRARIVMPLPLVVLDHDTLAAVATVARQIIRADRRFAMAARNIEHVSRLA